MPDTVQTSVLTQLDQLSAASRSLLQATVLECEFDLPALTSVPPDAFPEVVAGLLECTLTAAEEATVMFANQEAAELYQLASIQLEALGEEVHWETAVQVFTGWARVWQLLGKFTGAKLTATRALKLCLMYGDIARTLPVYNLLAEINYYQACYSEAQDFTTKVINSLADQTPPGELAQAYLWSGMAASALSEYTVALSRLERAEDICLATDDSLCLARVLAAKAFIHCARQAPELALAIARRAVQLAQITGITRQIGLALYDLSQIQLRYGQPTAALSAVDEAIDLIGSPGHNLLAHVLTHRAAVLTYLGAYSAARSDVQAAVALFEDMDDVRGLLEAYLLWGSEYSSAKEEWAEAHAHLAKADQLLTAQVDVGGMYAQEQVRLWLGLGQVALQTNQLSQATSFFSKAAILIRARNLLWWQPAAYYFTGLVKLIGARLEDEPREARRYFQAALAAVYEGGCPDYLPLILLKLAGSEPDTGRRWQYLEACIETAQKRARNHDRILCYHQAGALLAQSDDTYLHGLGVNCLSQVRELRLAHV